MAVRIPVTPSQPCSLGRGFAVLDPERQREVVGYVRSGPAEATRAERASAAKASRGEWMRRPVGRDDEGSSSRHR
jgi:hypothetical protein